MNKYLIFIVDNQSYAIDINSVQELRSYEVPTRIPKTKEHFLGVLNLRGHIVGLTDLRMLWKKPCSYNDFTIHMICNINKKTISFVVDSVAYVVDIDPHEISEMNFDLDYNSCITGVFSVENQNILLIDPMELLKVSDE